MKIYVGDPDDALVLQSLRNCSSHVDSLEIAFIVSEVEVVSPLDKIATCAHSNVGQGQESGERFRVGMNKSGAPKCERS